MAVMYPSGIFSGTKSPGERKIFQQLRDDPATREWIVIHSLDVAAHRSQLQGEVDFVVIVPGKGVLCLEVKAVRSIRCENGAWYLGSKPDPEYRGPFKQASEAMHSIREYVVRADPSLSKVLFFSAVVFPYVRFDVQSNEWHPWQVIDRERYESCAISEVVGGVLDRARIWLANNPKAKWFSPASGQPTAGESRHLAQILRPAFEFFETPEARARHRSDELKKYTEEQFEALDTMSLNERVIFEGPAGTGKTLLAVEAARRAQAVNKKVLFVCYNRLLGNWLSTRMDPLEPQVHTSTLHAHMLQVAGIEVPPYPTSAFWEYDLPEAAVDALLQDPASRHVYGALVIDEAQDVLRKEYLDFLDLSLEGGLEAGTWRMFGDFEKQAIYQDAPEPVVERLSKLFTAVPRYSLRVNCRNPLRIAEFIHLLGGLEPKYSRVRRPDNGYRPRIVPYAHEEQQKQLLAAELNQLQSGGVRDSEITILSFHGADRAIVKALPHKWQARLVPLGKSAPVNGISYGTVHAFKGLESPVVVVTDVEAMGNEKAQALFYVAVSRALERLSIFVHQDARPALLEALLKMEQTELS